MCSGELALETCVVYAGRWALGCHKLLCLLVVTCKSYWMSVSIRKTSCINSLSHRLLYFFMSFSPSEVLVLAQSPWGCRLRGLWCSDFSGRRKKSIYLMNKLFLKPDPLLKATANHREALWQLLPEHSKVTCSGEPSFWSNLVINTL